MGYKLVYRSLRKMAKWALDGFYSEVYVSGQENVPTTGPVLITASHHNELLDVASIAANMPGRRPVCFWAKSSMFTNPILKAIMTSAGSIPVRRNPNDHSRGDRKGDDSSDSRLALFEATFRAFDADEVIGVFPEGTSYTEPQIVQVKEGAAWVALEYARWQTQQDTDHTHGERRKLVVIPVGIVYSDKSHFQSRIFVQFGEPIDLEPYIRRHLSSVDSRAEVRHLTSEIKARLFKLTVNAKDWDHCFAGSIARDILSGGTDAIAQEAFVAESQRCVDRLVEEKDTETTNALVKYYALLHHSGISHEVLATLYPKAKRPTRTQSLLVFLQQLLTTISSPRSLAFIPVGLVHIPAYIAGALAGKHFVNADEYETLAERKIVCGGLAFGFTSAFIGNKVYNILYDLALSSVRKGTLQALSSWTEEMNPLLPAGPTTQAVRSFGKFFGMAVTMYWTVWLLFRWHAALVLGSYKQFQNAIASWTILTAIWFPPYAVLTSAQLSNLSRPLLPAPSPYLRRRDVPGSDAQPEAAKPIPSQDNDHPHPPSSRLLVDHLLVARADAEAVVERVFEERGSARW